MPPRHPDIARALGIVRQQLSELRVAAGPERCGARPELVVACSGGADSVALLGLLALLGASDGWRLRVAHVDHGLREESADEAAWVAALAKRLEAPFVGCRLSLERGPGIAVRAREARRGALAQWVRSTGAVALVLGHTASDQAETLVLNLCRGAGLDGLTAMSPLEPARGHWVVRPLLTLPRSDTRRLCRELCLPYLDDPTNEDLTQPRVQVRRLILPAMDVLRGGVVSSLAAAAARLEEARTALNTWTSRELANRLQGSGLSLEAWISLPQAIRLSVLRAAFLEVGVPPDRAGRRVVSTIDRALVSHSPAERTLNWDLGGGYRAELPRAAALLRIISPDAPISSVDMSVGANH